MYLETFTSKETTISQEDTSRHFAVFTDEQRKERSIMIQDTSSRSLEMMGESSWQNVSHELRDR